MYNRETMTDAGYKRKKRLNKDEILLWNPATDTTELWHRSPHYAGYAIVINRETYEFVASVPNTRYCSEHKRWEDK